MGKSQVGPRKCRIALQRAHHRHGGAHFRRDCQRHRKSRSGRSPRRWQYERGLHGVSSTRCLRCLLWTRFRQRVQSRRLVDGRRGISDPPFGKLQQLRAIAHRNRSQRLLGISVTGNAATATLATKASTLSQGGGNGTAMTFTWAGQGGQPTWLWGSNDGANVYV